MEASKDLGNWFWIRDLVGDHNMTLETEGNKVEEHPSDEFLEKQVEQ